MATITLEYDARNENISALLDVIKNLGAVWLGKPRKTGLDKAIEDIEKGRVYTAKNAKDLIAQCLQ
jgi:transposase